MAELRPFITEPASALTPEAEFNECFQGGRARFDVGRREGFVTIEEEKPWHVHAARYIAMRMPVPQVAEACECAESTVRVLLNQPWFQQRVQQFMTADGTKDVMNLLNAEAISSLQVLVTLRDDVKVSPTVRSANAKSILEWHLGKPTQRVEVAPGVSSSDPVAEAEQLEAEVLRMKGAL